MIKDLKNNERQEFHCLLREVVEKASSGGPYCELTVNEEGGSPVKAKIWKTKKEDLCGKTPEMTAVVLGITMQEYKGTPSYIADTVRPDPDRAPDDIGIYAEESSIDGVNMVRYMEELAARKIPDGPCKEAVAGLIEEYSEQLAYWPAATMVHHNCRGGLAQHLGTVASDCMKYAKVAAGNFWGMEEKDALKHVFSILKRTGGMAAGKAMDVYRHMPGNVGEGCRKIFFTVSLCDRLAANYPMLDRGLLVPAAALRGISMAAGDPLATGDGIGPEAADMLRLANECTEEEIASEEVSLLMHCLLVVPGKNGLKGVIPEAFLASYAGVVADMAYSMKDAKPDCGLLAAGALLHDIGKLREIDSNKIGVGEYSIEGNKFHHIGIGLQMVAGKAAELDIPASDLKPLLHIIASHHGGQELGAFVEPSTYEAKVLAHMDFIDSRMGIYERELKNLEPGGKSSGARSYLGNSVYSRKREE